MKKSTIVIGSGCAGLIAAKELKEKGFDVKIFEKSNQLGGIWSNLPWKTYTLTSSKWVTEYGCYPMPETYPDFVTNKHMLQYLESFTDSHQLRSLIDFNVSVSAIEKKENGGFLVRTDRGNYDNIDYIAVCSGLHGKPYIPEYRGLPNFRGEVLHSSKYHDPNLFKDKRVLCVGLGESGVGLVSELAAVTSKLVVSSQGVAVAPRVIKGSQNPFDQMQFWQIGRYIIGYQELLTSGLSWYYRKIPLFLKKISFTTNIKFYSDYGVKFEQFEKWLPKDLVPHHFHIKFWAKPANSSASGNLTSIDSPPDDIFYLIKTNKISPKGEIKSFDDNGVLFDDGSIEEIDSIIFNTGFQPGSSRIKFPGEWQYKHLDLFKGCIHPLMPSLAFIGMVRPTIGSIPAMAEMHSRIVAAYFSGSIPLPSEQKRIEITEQDNKAHQEQCPKMHERFPHIYFFDDWMEKMAAPIGAAPSLKNSFTSLQKLRAYFFGAPMPLRYRMQGEGKLENASETYIKRVNSVWGNAFGQWATATILIHLFTPYVLSLLCFGLFYETLGFSALISTISGISFYLLYRFVDLFRFVFEIGIARTFSMLTGVFFIRRLKQETPNYEQPKIFQTLKIGS